MYFQPSTANRRSAIVSQVQTEVHPAEHSPNFLRIIGLLTLRSEIDREIENRLSETFEIDQQYLKKLAAEATEYMLPYFTHTPYDLKNTHAASPSTGPSAPSASPASPPAAAAPQELATAPPASVATPAPLLNPISVLKLAKGWEEKLIERGVQTVGDLGKWIYESKLVPGFAPRVGPDAVEKIKAAWRGYVYPNGVGDGGVVNPPTGASAAQTGCPKT